MGKGDGGLRGKGGGEALGGRGGGGLGGGREKILNQEGIYTQSEVNLQSRFSFASRRCHRRLELYQL